MTASDDKSLKGKGHDFPPHDHEAIRHSHGHSHITHYRKPGERDEWKHLTATHDHEHDHAAITPCRVLQVVFVLLRGVLAGFRSRRDVALENLVLRHQLPVALRTNP